MLVNNSSWQLVAATDPDKFIAQNVGKTRIGFVIQASAPADDSDPLDPDYIDLESEEHGQFLPGQPPLTISGIDTDGNSMYVRTLGPNAGLLYIA